MKKILKSELTPQLVKHQEATLQLFNIQRDIVSPVTSFSMSLLPESYRLFPFSPLPMPSFLQIMKTEFVEHQKSVDTTLYKP